MAEYCTECGNVLKRDATKTYGRLMALKHERITTVISAIPSECESVLRVSITVRPLVSAGVQGDDVQVMFDLDESAKAIIGIGPHS
jgi:hypothetical protein